MTELTGQGLDRVDGRLKVTGTATYSADVPVANVAHAVIVGSSIAAGRVSSIDSRAALASPGVLAVLTHANAPKLPGASAKGPPNDRKLQHLEDDVVHYDGQPVAVVVADTLERARHAERLLAVSYEAHSPSVVFEADARDAYAPAKLVRDPTDTDRGEFQQAFDGAPVRVEQTYMTPNQHHNPMEPHATIAVWQGPDHLTLYDATQGVFSVRGKIARLFGLPEAQVRVLSLFLGGGFGCKGTPWSHVPLAAMAARVVGRPVKLVITRQQMFALVGHRPKTIQRVSLGAGRDGTLKAVEHRVVSHTSRFDEFVEGSAVVTRSLYSCPNVRTSHRLVRLDVATPTFMRAPGESTGNFALESAMDELSYALALDPVALRLKNYADRDQDKNRPWSSKALRECYEQGRTKFGWSRRSPTTRATRDGTALVGMGMATASYPAHQTGASASVRIRQDGTALVQAGTQDLGTGTYTIMTQIAADALGLPMESVRFELGDTELPEAPLSGGSQTAASTGSAVRRACLQARSQLVQQALADEASPLHEALPADVGAANGTLYSKHDRARRDPYSEILRRGSRTELVVMAHAEEKPERKDYGLRAFGAQFAEVRVDEVLGRVSVSRLVGVFSAGRILNAKTARSQLIGGMVWGIGFALGEHTERDPRDGRVVTRDLADYHVPVNADVPDVDVTFVEERDPHVNDVGAKGVGELGITGSVAAIANAVYHATGKRIRELPILPEKIL